MTTKYTLKPNEVEILDLLCRGYNQKQISTKLGVVNHQIVRDRLRCARERMDCTTNEQMVAEFAVARALKKLENQT